MSSVSSTSTCAVVTNKNFQDAQPATLYEPTPLVEYLSDLPFLPSTKDDLVEWMMRKTTTTTTNNSSSDYEYPLRFFSLPLLGSTMALLWGLGLLLLWKCRGASSYFWSGGNKTTTTVTPPPLAPSFTGITTGVIDLPPSPSQSRWKKNKYSSWMSSSSSQKAGEGRGRGVVLSTSSSVDTCKHANTSTTVAGTGTTTGTPSKVFDDEDNDDEVSSQHSWMLELSQSRGGTATTTHGNLLCLEETSSSSSSLHEDEDDDIISPTSVALGTTTISEMTSLFMDDEDNDISHDNEEQEEEAASPSLLATPPSSKVSPSSGVVYPLPMGLVQTETETRTVSASSQQQHPYAEFMQYLQEVSGGAYSSNSEDDGEEDDNNDHHHNDNTTTDSHDAASSSLQKTHSHVSRDSADWLLEQVLNGSSHSSPGHDHADFDFDDDDDNDNDNDDDHDHDHDPNDPNTHSTTTPSSPTLLFRETWPATHELVLGRRPSPQQHSQSQSQPSPIPLNTSFPQEEDDPHFLFLQDDDDDDHHHHQDDNVEVTKLPPTTPAPMTMTTTTTTTKMTTPMVQAHYKPSSTTNHDHDHHLTPTTTTTTSPPPQQHRNWLVTDDSQLLGDVSGIVIRSCAVVTPTTPIAPQLLAELSLAESASGLLSEDDDDDDNDDDDDKIVAKQTFSAINTSLLDEEPTQDVDEEEEEDEDIVLPNDDAANNNTSSEVDAVLDDMIVMPLSSSVESDKTHKEEEESKTKSSFSKTTTTKSRSVIQRAAQDTDSTQNVEDSESYSSSSSSYSRQQEDDDDQLVVTTTEDSFLDHPATDEEAWKEYEVAYGKWQAQHLQFLSRLNRWRNCVVVACTILVGATIMGALNGVYALESQKQTVTEAWEALQTVAQRTQNDLIEVVQRQVLWNQDMDIFWQILNEHCPLLDANLCSTSTSSLEEEAGEEDSDGLAVSFNCNVTGIPLQDEWQDWLGVYQSPTHLQDQLVTPEDWAAWAWDAHDFETLPVTEGLEGWNWAFWAAVACNALLSGACIWILMAIAVERSPRIQNHLATWSFALLYWVTLGLSWIFGILFWVGTILTVDACTAASDDGGIGREGPSTIAKLLMDRHFGGKDSEDSTSLPTFWDYHMDGCLPEEYPTFLNDRVRVWAEYLPVTAQLVRGLESFSELEFLQRCGAPIGPLKEAASNLNLQTCRVTSSLSQVRESLGCDEWYPWYESMVPNAICEQGSKAFVWSSACQMVILFLGFFIWTFRASFVSLAVQPTRPTSRTSSGSQVEDSISRPQQGGETTGHYRIT